MVVFWNLRNFYANLEKLLIEVILREKKNSRSDIHLSGTVASWSNFLHDDVSGNVPRKHPVRWGMYSYVWPQNIVALLSVHKAATGKKWLKATVSEGHRFMVSSENIWYRLRLKIQSQGGAFFYVRKTAYISICDFLLGKHNKLWSDICDGYCGDDFCFSDMWSTDVFN